MLSPLSRPNFFPGQMIDYKDFNRLAAHTDKTLSLVCAQLFPDGGIVSGALDTFEVTPLRDLSVVIKPGVALLPNGELLVVSRELVVDLRPYATKAPKTVIVSLKNELQGRDKFEDESDASVTGYRCEVFDPTLSISARKPSNGSVEIFRVHLSDQMRSLRLSSEEEEWNGESLADGEGRAGILDIRFRSYLLPQTARFGSALSLIEMRQALSSLSDSLSILENIYVFADKRNTAEVLTQLHAEFLSTPFQEKRTGFLASECAHRLSIYLEKLERHVGHQALDLDREGILKSITLLQEVRSQALHPSTNSLANLVKVAHLLESIVRFGREKYNLVHTLQEGLADIADYNFPFGPKISLAGRVFQRCDYLDAGDEKRVKVRATQAQLRKLSAEFLSGDSLVAKGLFVKEGTYTLFLSNIDPEKPLLMLSRRYVRRAGSRIHYELNGKPLLTEQELSGEKANRWTNRGLVVAADALVPQGNTLKIRVEKSDLDFGFFDLAAYQPYSETHSNKEVQS